MRTEQGNDRGYRSGARRPIRRHHRPKQPGSIHPLMRWMRQSATASYTPRATSSIAY